MIRPARLFMLMLKIFLYHSDLKLPLANGARRRLPGMRRISLSELEFQQ
jgi:hypothetical protein